MIFYRRLAARQKRGFLKKILDFFEKGVDKINRLCYDIVVADVWPQTTGRKKFQKNFGKGVDNLNRL